MQHYARPDARLAKARRLGFQAWRKRDEAERLAIPPREPEPVPGQEVYRITVECAGSMHIITAHWPRASGVRRPRSDQFRVPGYALAQMRDRWEPLPEGDAIAARRVMPPHRAVEVLRPVR